MPFQPITNGVKIQIRGKLAGEDVENVIYAQKVGGAYTITDLSTVAEAVSDWWAAQMKGKLPSTYVLTDVLVTGQAFANDLQVIQNEHAGETGSNGGAAGNNISKAFSLRSGFTGRSARGRMFFPGIHTGYMSDANHVSQGFVDDVIDILELLKLVIEAAGFIWIIVSRYTGGVPRTTAAVFPVINMQVANLTVDSMRGRMPKS
jgi:hypothetical protein